MIHLAVQKKLIQHCKATVLLLSRFSHVPPGSSVPGILQARIPEWVAISFSHAWKQKQVGCMRQLLRAGVLGWPRGMGCGGRWEGDSGWRAHVNPWLIHINVWQKPLQYCKVISLQLIWINEKKFFLKGKKMKAESEVAQSCPTLKDPIDCSLPGSSVCGILQARVLEWVAISFSKSNCTPIKFLKRKKWRSLRGSVCYLSTQWPSSPTRHFILHLVPMKAHCLYHSSNVHPWDPQHPGITHLPLCGQLLFMSLVEHSAPLLIVYGSFSYWFTTALLVKMFTSDWDLNPCAGTQIQPEPSVGLEPMWLDLEPSQNPVWDLNPRG